MPLNNSKILIFLNLFKILSQLKRFPMKRIPIAGEDLKDLGEDLKEDGETDDW